MAGFTSLAEAAERLARRWKGRAVRSRALLAWPRLIGNHLASLSQAFGTEEGVILVRVEDPTLLFELRLAAPGLAERYRRAGFTWVREVRFLPGRMTASEPNVTPTPSLSHLAHTWKGPAPIPEPGIRHEETARIFGELRALLARSREARKKHPELF